MCTPMTSPSRRKPLVQMKEHALAQRQAKPSGSARPSPSGRTLSCVACLNTQRGSPFLSLKGTRTSLRENPDLLANIHSRFGDAARGRCCHAMEKIARSNIGRCQHAETLPVLRPYVTPKIDVEQLALRVGHGSHGKIRLCGADFRRVGDGLGHRRRLRVRWFCCFVGRAGARAPRPASLPSRSPVPMSSRGAGLVDLELVVISHGLRPVWALSGTLGHFVQFEPFPDRRMDPCVIRYARLRMLGGADTTNTSVSGNPHGLSLTRLLPHQRTCTDRNCFLRRCGRSGLRPLDEVGIRVPLGG